MQSQQATQDLKIMLNAAQSAAETWVRKFEAAQPKWIGVEERLPDQPGQVLIGIHDYVGIAWYNDYCFEFGNGMKFAVDYPNTCWMPLPEPPKEADAT